MGLFSSENTKKVKKLEKIAKKVLALEETYSKKTNEELINTTNILKQELNSGKSLNDILPEAFALVREASFRVLNMKHYKVQIMGGIALHQGRIAEMKTGEGKTLVATLPAYLNALTGLGVHIVTVNDYLAKRDAEWMGKVYKFLGLTVGVVIPGMSNQAKREAYNCDITYCTNNELGFDYLRDNMVVDARQRVQRPFNFGIIDEVDSILIDEARTPLIISGAGGERNSGYESADNFVKKLVKDEDYTIDEEHKAIHLTEKGVDRAERTFNVENLADLENMELNHYIMNALKANYIMIRDENYIVKDNEILIVDEFTGRLMQGRRYSDGLHQAIEAKEGVKIKEENKTLATITFQNFFRLYKKLSGMTGTAKTEEAEFNKIYNLDVVCIPSNLKTIRKDAPDIIYTTINGKYRAIIEEIKRVHATGQPVLVGTITIDKSEAISKLLRKEGIKHNVLNAKNHEQESEIIAQAGRKGSVTIATNMAGRGTDILLGGNPEYMAKQKMRLEGFTDEEISFCTSFLESNEENLVKAKERYKELYNEFYQITSKEKEEVRNVGGLYIMGTERHESRRIDNQLRGRAGRQGDPGNSVFFISMEDELIKRFGGDRLKRISEFFKIDENTPIQFRMISRQIENAQRKIEGYNFSIRRNVLSYDDVMNKQREIIYAERNKVLDNVDIHDEILTMVEEVVSEIVFTYLNDKKEYTEWKLDDLNNALEDRILLKGTNLITEKFVKNLSSKEVNEKVLKYCLDKIQEKIDFAKEIDKDFADVERAVLLHVVDKLWMDHIDAMSTLKNEIGLQAYGQHDPVIMYKREGFDMFEEMIENIKERTVGILININIEKPVEAPKAPKIVIKQVTVRNTEKEVGRNDPCPCGSGKKYKNCCGKNE